MYFSENPNLNKAVNYGILYDVNLYYWFVDNLKNLNLFNFSENVKKSNNTLLLWS